MTRLLFAIAAVELIAGGYLIHRHRNVVRPPVLKESYIDVATATELRELAANLHTAGDWAKLGEAYLATGHFPEAEACWRQAAVLDPSADLSFKHAFALERLGRIEEANDAYRTAATNGHSRAADVWYHIGRNELRLENPTAAGEAFAKAGTLPGARFERAKLNARAGRLAEADAEAERLASEFPTAYSPLALRIRLAIGRSDRTAEAAFGDAFARRPRPLPTPFDAEVDWILGKANGVGRARLFRDAGRDVQAGKAAAADAKLREALQARWDPEVADKLAEIAFVQNRRDEALRLLSEVVERGGPTHVSLWRRGQAEEAAGRSDEALASWERAATLASGPNGRELLADLSARCEKLGRSDRAKAYLARSQLAAGIDALDGGRLDEAADWLDRATRTEPGSAAASFELAEVHRRSGRTSEARAGYLRCLQLDALHGRATRAVALLPPRD